MTTVRLGQPGEPAADLASILERHRPAWLVAYPDLHLFVDAPYRPFVRDWSLDSGAFSAWTRGQVIDRDEFHETARHLLATDPKLVEVFALDVIGDWRASITNAELAWAAGIPAIPTFHVGDPTHVLKTLCAQFPKVALGGAVRYARKIAWAQQCFAQVWPKPLHGLGFGAATSVLTVPFHSVDASTWATEPLRFGKWNHLSPYKSSPQMSVYGPKTGMMDGPVRAQRLLEDKARMRWAKEMPLLDAMLVEANWRGVAA